MNSAGPPEGRPWSVHDQTSDLAPSPFPGGPGGVQDMINVAPGAIGLGGIVPPIRGVVPPPVDAPATTPPADDKKEEKKDDKKDEKKDPDKKEDKK